VSTGNGIRREPTSLGAVRFVQVGPELWVANMVAQHELRGGDEPPIRYPAVEECLGKVAQKAKELAASVHMPRIGCGLAGGKWEVIEPIINKTLCELDVPVTVYDF
jgi:O-acetyl-ADP-ribose deacetylase (regulator of RNase III)